MMFRAGEFFEILDGVPIGALNDWLNEHGWSSWRVVCADGVVYMVVERIEDSQVMTAAELRECVDGVRRKNAGH